VRSRFLSGRCGADAPTDSRKPGAAWRLPKDREKFVTKSKI